MKMNILQMSRAEHILREEKSLESFSHTAEMQKKIYRPIRHDDKSFFFEFIALRRLQWR